MAEMVTTRMTATEFLALPESNRLEQLLHGEYLMSPPPTDAHQKVVGKIFLTLTQFLTTGELRIAPTGVYLEEENFVEPDIFWVNPENTHCQLHPDGRYWHGAPDLVVEVLSPSTAAQDRGSKFDLYEKHGVREYWLADPEAQFVEVYTLVEQTFTRQGVFVPGENFVSPVLGGQAVEVGRCFA